MKAGCFDVSQTQISRAKYFLSLPSTAVVLCAPPFRIPLFVPRTGRGDHNPPSRRDTAGFSEDEQHRVALSFSRLFCCSPATRYPDEFLYTRGGRVPLGLLQPKQSLHIFELLPGRVGPPPPLQNPRAPVSLASEALCLLAKRRARHLGPVVVGFCFI